MIGLEGLNEQQKNAVQRTEGPLLVVAGAGTGKTKVITRRIVHLIEKGIQADKILAVTFTNKAADEMKSRVTDLVKIESKPSPRPMPTIGTFHSIASDILRKNGKDIGVPPHFTIIDERHALEIIKSNIERLGLNLRQFRPNSIQNAISKKKSNSFQEAALSQKPDNSPFLENLNLIMQEYRKRLEAKNSLDFDDLIQKTIFLLENNPKILQIYQEKWPYIHIDEYQDTDPGQARLIRILGQKYNNVCAVGDEDQSIYGFRGTDFSNILNFEKIWPQTQIVVLERNYRSTKRILEASNAVISKNILRREKKLYTKNKIGPYLTIRDLEDEKNEAEFITEEIKTLLKKPLTLPIAVLCRANFQIPVIEELFLKNKIPYRAALEQDFLSEPVMPPVRLMTVHAAKGLEFKYVFIPGLEKGLFPYINGQETADSEEERRLFYVALTRSQEKIYLSYSKFRNSFGAKKINEPSPFLNDIPKKSF